MARVLEVPRVPRYSRHLRHSRCYDRKASRKGPPLQGSDSSPDDPIVDFPLRETDPPSPLRGYGGQARPDSGRRELLASSVEEPRHRGGLKIWLAAAAALVIGIGIGFASGYRAGKGSTSVAATGTESPAATSGATGGQPFSESAVQEPVNLNPPPIVPAPVTVPADRPRRPERTAAPAPQRQPALAEAPATGPASLQVESRPSGAQVILDGRSIGKTPMTIPDVAAGDHNIRLELAGFKGWATTVDVKAGAATRVAASLEQ